MNIKFLLGSLVACITSSLIPTNVFSQTSNNQPPYRTDRISFYCGEIEDEASGETIPATIAYVPQRKASVSVIGWKTYIPDWDAQRRCETVSPKFQAFHEDGRLDYLITGEKKGYNIICAAVEEGRPCNPDDQLFQVKANNDPEAVLKDLTGIIEGAASDKPIYQSSGGKIHVSMEELLNAAPAIEDKNLTAN